MHAIIYRGEPLFRESDRRGDYWWCYLLGHGRRFRALDRIERAVERMR